MLSSWGRATSVAGINKESSSDRAFGLEAVLTYSDGTTETHYASFDATTIHGEMGLMLGVKDKPIMGGSLSYDHYHEKGEKNLEMGIQLKHCHGISYVVKVRNLIENMCIQY